ncbi:MAG TPA: lipoyl(octanoyl) transferase LipB [Stellaceae bacterium]|jgi:lipoyl(octanoyl) transferase|nr:lipoyl(octanoyl) transferase LipB [Stellaceae bacterium]
MDYQTDTISNTLVASRDDAIEWRTADRLVPYEEAVATMEARVAAIHAGAASELIWLVEHPPLYTAGTSAVASDLLEPSRLPVFKAGRGGQYTYHGPGQRVAYVMLDLTRPKLGQGGRDVGCHVWRLEEWMIRVCARFGMTAERREGRVGVWIRRGAGREDKIGAIGVRVRHWVTYHGLALNVDPDLANYAGIVPCGISGHGVTSLAALGVKATIHDVDSALRDTFDDVFASAPECRADPASAKSIASRG